VPRSLLGRVSSLDWFISIALLPLSFAITAPVAAAFGARATLIGAGVLGGAVTLGALFLPHMREPDGFPEILTPGPGPGPGPGPTPADPRREVVDALAQLTRAFARRDADALLTSCTDDVTYLGSEDGEQATGRVEVSELLATVFARSEAYIFNWHRALIGTEGRTAWLLANGTGTVRPDASPDSQNPETFTYRLSGVLRQEGERWCWVLIHAGEPTPPAEMSATTPLPLTAASVSIGRPRMPGSTLLPMREP
jgi:ketosteroid isomerase-like protein